MSALHPFLGIAQPLAVKAAQRLMELRLEPLERNRKPDHSLVTNADHEADRILRSGLREAFPDHAILTEESGLEGSIQSEYMWVIDPLDGTRAYVKGVAGFSVMVGLLQRGKPFAGIVVDPLEGHIYEAVLGKGCFHTLKNQQRQVSVSKRSQFIKMPVVTSTGFPEKYAAALKAGFTGEWLAPINSVGIKVGLLVRQVGDIYINHHSVHYWDTCAPQIILEEAGGQFSFMDGRPLTYDLTGSYQHDGPSLATNATRHSDAIQIVRDHLTH